ncbi:MAG: redoxin domain-containing protein, partial [Solobacterium sp.]|nr:redoxin domain-containing protein [Solobacterium sp.]
SKDNVASHKKFEEKHSLPFTLLSDESTEVLQKYDVWKEKQMYGRTYMGIERSTYLIDEKGKIIKAYQKVKSAVHPEEVVKDLG